MSDVARPSDDELASEITNTLLRVINRVQRDKARNFGADASMTMVEAEVCYRILRQDGVSGVALSEQLAVSRSAISQVLSRLRSRGLVTETGDAHNGKRKLLHLTPEGMEAVRRSLDYYKLMVHEVLAVPREELESYLRFVRKLESFQTSATAVLDSHDES